MSTLAVDDAAKHFRGLRALDGVSLSVSEGEIVGLIGPNGSGKTTLLNLASGVLRPTAGRISVAGVDATGHKPHEFARLGVGRTFQQIRLFAEMTVAENVEVGAVARGQDTAGAIVASVIGLALTRMRENAMAMATIGVLVILFVVFDNWEGLTRGATGLFGIPRSTTVWSALVFAVITIAICRFYRESNPGLELRASRTDSLAAEALGSNVVRLRWWAWTLSGALMGMGGALWAQYNIAFGPKQFFFSLTFGLLAILVVGGLGSVSGAVIGAVVVTAVFEIMRRIEDNIDVPGITQIVVALVILLVLYRRPNGLMGLSEADDVLARRFSRARRRGTQAPPG